MASIYDMTTGDTISDGLQGCEACDEAIKAAQDEARERGESVLLDDDDGQWVVPADGSMAERYED